MEIISNHECTWSPVLAISLLALYQLLTAKKPAQTLITTSKSAGGKITRENEGDQDNERHDKSAAEANNNTNSIVTSYGYILTGENDEKLSNTPRPASEDCPEDTSTALSASQLEYTPLFLFLLFCPDCNVLGSDEGFGYSEDRIAHRSRGSAPRPAHSLRDTRPELLHVKELVTDSPAAQWKHRSNTPITLSAVISFTHRTFSHNSGCCPYRAQAKPLEPLSPREWSQYWSHFASTPHAQTSLSPTTLTLTVAVAVESDIRIQQQA
ncbi:unnamed protein product [Pleuronectes platessa]|uniref:Uncharacterized protein n=1 Tax=Pleuronectes platessa TaxID=8262 RepID=A0A9N7Z1A3_PLEPL|nr:unnamed protein product [Pleuronectes platessa]